MKLSRFNQVGISTFSEFLDKLERAPKTEIPEDLLTSPSFSEKLESDTDIEFYEYKTRFSIAGYLNTILNETGLPSLDRDIGLWSWLAAFFFNLLCPVDSSGKRKIGERARYIPELDNYKRYYRHLLLGPYLIYRTHKDNPERAMALLCGPLNKISEVDSQIAATQALITNKSVVELATRLYYDPRTKTTKTGSGGKGSGSPRRLVAVLGQFDKTWDLYASSVEELISLLPQEFNSFLNT